SQDTHSSRKPHSSLLCGGDGEQRARVDPVGPIVRQVRPKHFPVRLSYFRRCCPFCFSGYIHPCVNRDDFLGNWDERARFSVSGNAYSSYSTAKTQHGFWVV